MNNASALTRPLAKKRPWAGIAVTALPVLFLTFDVAIKLANVPEVAESMGKLGWPADLGPALGVILLASLALYVIPRTAPLGAVLLTAYLGGAVATHLRVGDPLASHTLFPVYVGVLLWVGLFLREERLRLVLAMFLERTGDQR